MPDREHSAKLVKVTLEWSDGEIQTMEGPAADRWISLLNARLGFLQARSGKQDAGLGEANTHWVKSRKDGLQ